MTRFTTRHVLLLIGVFALAPAPAAAERRSIPMTADRWDTAFGAMEFKPHKDAQAMVIAADSAASVKGLTFRNGTVEFDVDFTAMGGGLAFHMRDRQALELLYFRPRPNCEALPDCVQYAPFTHGVLLWDAFPQYQSSAPLRQGEWNHVKVVISGRRMKVFVNGGSSPALSIGSLEGDVHEGQLALFGPGAFANLTIDPNAVEGLSPAAETDPSSADTRIVRHWQLAPFSELADGVEPAIADLPKPSAAWRAVAAERGGLVNITRVYGLPAKRPARSVTWLTTTITSATSQTKQAAIGWGREVWVFVNGERVFADRNAYQPPNARKPPDGRIALANGSLTLPLKAGPNEIAVAVANNFYGWGLILRLENDEGIRLARR